MKHKITFSRFHYKQTSYVFQVIFNGKKLLYLSDISVSFVLLREFRSKSFVQHRVTFIGLKSVSLLKERRRMNFINENVKRVTTEYVNELKSDQLGLI